MKNNKALEQTRQWFEHGADFGGKHHPNAIILAAGLSSGFDSEHNATDKQIKTYLHNVYGPRWREAASPPGPNWSHDNPHRKRLPELAATAEGLRMKFEALVRQRFANSDRINSTTWRRVSTPTGYETQRSISDDELRRLMRHGAALERDQRELREECAWANGALNNCRRAADQWETVEAHRRQLKAAKK